MKEFVKHLLKDKLSQTYYYHSYEHTFYVLDKVIEIGTKENCTREEIVLLSAAALWHDTGYIMTYINHEEQSCLLAKKHLPDYGYSIHEINTICAMILATKIPQSPQNKLEEIIADADLEYLGTDHASIKAESLFKELQSLNPLLTKKQWNQTQVSFLHQHHFFTKYCKEYKNPGKLEYLHKLETLIR